MRHAQTSSKPFSHTQAAEATTNHENDNEPRRTASNMKPTRESDGAPTPRKELNGSSRSAIYANRSSKPVLYTQAAKATTNHENDNEPRRTAFVLIMKPARKSDGAPTPRKKLNGSSRNAIYANRGSEPVSHTSHTDQELQANQRQAAPSTKRRS